MEEERWRMEVEAERQHDRPERESASGNWWCSCTHSSAQSTEEEDFCCRERDLLMPHLDHLDVSTDESDPSCVTKWKQLNQLTNINIAVSPQNQLEEKTGAGWAKQSALHMVRKKRLQHMKCNFMWGTAICVTSRQVARDVDPYAVSQEGYSQGGWMVLSGIPGFSQVSLKQRALQFLITGWKLMQARRPSSLLSNACTLASRMLREYPCGRDHSRCLISPCLLPRCLLPCWGECRDGSRDGLACLCGRGCSWCYSDVYIWNLDRQGSRVRRRRVHKAINWPFPYLDKRLAVICQLYAIIV